MTCSFCKLQVILLVLPKGSGMIHLQLPGNSQELSSLSGFTQ